MSLDIHYNIELILRKELIRVNKNDKALNVIYSSAYDAVNAYNKAIIKNR